MVPGFPGVRTARAFLSSTSCLAQGRPARAGPRVWLWALRPERRRARVLSAGLSWGATCPGAGTGERGRGWPGDGAHSDGEELPQNGAEVAPLYYPSLAPGPQIERKQGAGYQVPQRGAGSCRGLAPNPLPTAAGP